MEAKPVSNPLVRGHVVAVLLVLCGASPADAQDVTPGGRAPTSVRDTLILSFAEARRLVLEQNPAFLADRQDAEIARGELGAARVYDFNPELEFESTGAGTAGAIGEYEARLTQEVEWAGQRGLRTEAAELGLDRARYRVRDAARAALAEASTAYYAALAAERRREVAEEVLGLNRRLLDATRTQLREGEISALEANLVEIEFGRARARVLTALREATSARLALKRRIGVVPEQPIRLVEALPDTPDPSSLDRDALVALAIAERPDLAAWRAAVDQFRALHRLAGREAIPNLRIGVLVEREAVGAAAASSGRVADQTRIGFGLSFPIPLWDRNQGVRAQREAQVDQAALTREATELAIRTQVTDAYRSYLAASEEARVFQEDVLEPSRQNQALLELAYRAGKIDLPTLLLLRNQLLEAELGYWDAWFARREAWVELEAAIASLHGGEGEMDDNRREGR